MKSRAIWRSLGLVVLAAVLLATLAPAVRAFESRSGDTVVIGADEVVNDDLYVIADTFTLDGTVKGDVVVMGSTITINGVVEGDLIGGGQSLIINGVVQDDARVGGAAITVGAKGQVGDDLVGGGWSLETQPGSTVGGDLVFAGQQALLAGSVTGNVDTAVGSLKLTGTVGGDVDAAVGGPSNRPPFSPFMFMPNAPAIPSVPGGLTVEGAEIGGTLKYTSPQEYQVPESVKNEYTPPPVQPGAEAAKETRSPVLAWLLGFVRGFVALLLAGLLLVWLAPGITNKLVQALAAKPLPALGWGFVMLIAFLVLVPLILAVIIALAALFGFLTLGSLTMLAILLGLLLLFALVVAFILIASWLSRIVVSIWLGRLILQRIKPDWANHRIWPLLVGLIIVVLLSTIPILGGLVGLLISLWGLGAVWLWWQTRKDTAAIVPAA